MRLIACFSQTLSRITVGTHPFLKLLYPSTTMIITTAATSTATNSPLRVPPTAPATMLEVVWSEPSAVLQVVWNSLSLLKTGSVDLVANVCVARLLHSGVVRECMYTSQMTGLYEHCGLIQGLFQWIGNILNWNGALSRHKRQKLKAGNKMYV